MTAIHPKMGTKERLNKRAAVKRRDGDRCVRCGWFGDGGFLTLDHIVPLARGGNNELPNLQLLCIHCNELKGTGIADYRAVAA